MRTASQQYRAHITGKENRASGQMFEEVILSACNRYRVTGAADIDKTPEPFCIEKPMGSGKFLGHFAKKAQPDFKGALAGGKAIVFEAKYTKTDRLVQTAVNDAQYKTLDSYQRLGAECFVLVCFGFRGFYKIPWAVFKAMKNKFGRKYVTENDLRRYELEFRNGVLDFLGETKWENQMKSGCPQK